MILKTVFWCECECCVAKSVFYKIELKSVVCAAE